MELLWGLGGMMIGATLGYILGALMAQGGYDRGVADTLGVLLNPKQKGENNGSDFKI